MNEVDSKRKQGPRRSEDSRSAILEASRAELAESGWRKFSVDSVAKRARASKQTIYRWWPAIGTMCVEAGLAILPPRSQLGRDAVERIADLVLPIETALRSGTGHSVLRGALLAACDDKDAGEAWRLWHKDHIRTPLRLILAEVASKNSIRRDFDVDKAVDSLLGPIWNRLLLMRAPIEEGYSFQQAQNLLKQLAP